MPGTDASHMKPSQAGISRILTTLAALSIAVTTSAQPVTHYYTVTVDYSLSWLWVEARFSRAVDNVIARSRNAGKYLVDVRGCDQEPEIRLRNRRMMLPQGGVRCLNYTVDLRRAASEFHGSRSLDDANVVVSPSYWLWRPELFSDASIQVDFHLPENVRVSVPWEQVDDSANRFVVGRSPENAFAPVVFGKFDYREIEVPGAVLRVSLVDTDADVDSNALFDWIQATATDVSLVYGRFPSPSPQVVVVPVTNSRASSPVPFGRVIRDGGETIELFVDPAQPLESFLDDWTATHEFSHLMLPYLRSEHHWISEGFAQYYQNVLLTRAGAYDEQLAWQKLHEGFERGRLSRPELSPNEAAAGDIRSARMKVYWSGAALALMADVTLRERSAGKESLDVVLERFQDCCLPSQDIWSGPEFFARLDSLISQPVFMPLYRRYADTAGFPDTSQVFERLGLKVHEDVVSVRRKAELQDIRSAITRIDRPTAQRRGQLAAY